MVADMRIFLTFLALSFAQFAAAQDLQSLLTDAAPGDQQAAVLCLWQDGKTECATTGRLQPNGRAIRSSDRFAIASVGKTVTAVALLQLVERGQLGLDDPANAHLSARTATAFSNLPGITLRHLLAMQSGLPDYYDEAYFDAVLQDRSKQTLDYALAQAALGRTQFRPGAEFEYSNTNYLLLQDILQNTTGQSLASYLKKHVLKRAGMADSFVFGTRSLPANFATGFENIRGRGAEDVSFYYTGAGLGDGPLIASAPDLVAFYRALFVTQKLLGQPILRQMLTDPLGADYGLGIEVENTRRTGPIYGHSGADVGFVADVRYAPKMNAIIVALMAGVDGDPSVTYEVLDELAR